MFDEQIQQAARAILSADALLIGAGAGMGVDSGLPDFRGDTGFWKAYPPFRGRSFADISTPHLFNSDPETAWGFFGHRLHLYRRTVPHTGFRLLRKWGESRPLGYFVFTSNIDGHFQKAGFRPECVMECHGSIHYLQCVKPCCPAIWPADELDLEIDEVNIRCRSALPLCALCGQVSRPNVVMFSDSRWVWDRWRKQRLHYTKWLSQLDGAKLVAVEMGAGLAIPTVREECEREATTLIRINPREAETPPGGISIGLGAAVALALIDDRLRQSA